MTRLIDSIQPSQASRRPRIFQSRKRSATWAVAAGYSGKASPASPAYVKPLKTSGRPSRLKSPGRSAINNPYQTAQQKRRRNWWIIAAMAVGVTLLLLLGGMRVIILPLLGVCFAVALWLRLSSKLAYGLALVSLLCIPLSQLLQLDDIAENYALYAYLLLVMGTIMLALEVRHSGRLKNFRKS